MDERKRPVFGNSFVWDAIVHFGTRQYEKRSSIEISVYYGILLDMDTSRLRFERISARETIVYASYQAGVVQDEFSIGRILCNRRNVWTVSIKTVDDTWEDTGYYGSYEQCVRFVTDDAYEIFGSH